MLGELPWWVTIVILIREVGITVYRFVALSVTGSFAASRGGKLKTLLQGDRSHAGALPVHAPGWATGSPGSISSSCQLAFVATVLSGLDYMRVAFRGSRGTEHA